MPLVGPIFLSFFVIFMSIQTFQEEEKKAKEKEKKAKKEEKAQSSQVLNDAIKKAIANALQA